MTNGDQGWSGEPYSMSGNPEELAWKDDQYLGHYLFKNQQQPPLIVAEAKGAWITDVHGKRYLDGMSGLWCVNVGYGRKELAEAAYRQMVQMPYYPLSQSHIPAIMLAEKLNEWLAQEGLDQEEYVIVFSNSGSEANETAFKIARQYGRQSGHPYRYKFVSRHRAYHGSTFGALAATGQSRRKAKYEPLAPGFLHVSPPDSYHRPDGMSEEQFNVQCAQAIEDMIRFEGAETIAGVIMEPVITGGGMIVPHPVYMQHVSDICRKYQVLLIMDEVICGFGRTGAKFGHHRFGISPDIVTMAKGLTSGYLPLAATAVRKSIFEALKRVDSDDYFRHVNTFGGNPAACALALANLEVMKREQLVKRADVRGEQLKQRLQGLAGHPLIGDIRCFGLLAGIEIVSDKQLKTPAPPSVIADMMGKCKERGLIVGKSGDTNDAHGNTMMLCPPFIITEQELAWMCDTLSDVFAEVPTVYG